MESAEVKDIKLVLKSVKGGTTDLVVPNNSTVLAIKEKIKEIKEIDIENQKLICRGKHLADDKSLPDYKIKENDCIILMILKKVGSKLCNRPEKTQKTKPQANPGSRNNPSSTGEHATGQSPSANESASKSDPHPQPDHFWRTRSHSHSPGAKRIDFQSP